MAQAGPWAGYSSFVAAAPSDTAPVSCRAIWVNCTVVGNLTLTPSKITSPGNAGVAFGLAVGSYLLPIELAQGYLNATGTTATATYTLLQ